VKKGFCRTDVCPALQQGGMMGSKILLADRHRALPQRRLSSPACRAGCRPRTPQHKSPGLAYPLVRARPARRPCAPRTHSARKAAAPAPAAPGRAAAASASRSAPSSASAHPGRVSLAPPCLARAGRCCTGELDADQGECCADEREAVATQQKIQMKMQGPDWGQTTCLMQTRPASAWPRRRGSARAPTPGPPSHAA